MQCGYFKESFCHSCVKCRTPIDNCKECNDWHGCTSCNYNYGYTVEWNINCDVNVCVANTYL